MLNTPLVGIDLRTEAQRDRAGQLLLVMDQPDLYFIERDTVQQPVLMLPKSARVAQAWVRTGEGKRPFTLHQLFQAAQVAQLSNYWQELWTIDVQIAQGGRNSGHETIQRAFLGWRKGTPRHEIEQAFFQHPRWNAFCERQRQQEEGRDSDARSTNIR